MVEIAPAIDIRGGRCVRLVQGDYERETVFDDDPVAAAQRWVDQGASILHVVDLDGARERRAVNAASVEAIAGLGLPVQIGGGIRDLATVRRYREAGVARIIIGTAAVTDRRFLGQALELAGDAVVVSVDARDGRLAIDGWTAESDLTATALIPSLERDGVSRFIYTDIASDGTLGGHNETAFAEVARAAASPVTAAGGISTVDQIRRLASVGAAGVILGRALYDGRLSLADALAAAAEMEAGASC